MSTRRGFLGRRLVASVSIGAIVSLSGCSNLLPSDSSGGNEYTSWLHEPGEFGKANHYSVSVLKPKTIHSNPDVFGDDLIDRMAAVFGKRFEPAGLDTTDLDRVITTGVAQVATGSFDESTVTEALTAADYTETAEVNGFQILTNGTPTSMPSTSQHDRHTAFAVNAEAIVRVPSASSVPSPTGIAAELVAVKTGDEQRYTDESESMALLTVELGDGYEVFTRTVEPRETPVTDTDWFENGVGMGLRRSLSGTTVENRFVFVYETPDDVDTEGIETQIDEAPNTTISSDLQTIEVSSSGRVAIFEGTADASDVSFDDATRIPTVERYSSGPEPQGTRAPAVTIDFSVTETAVSLIHAGGDPLGSNVAVRVNNENGDIEVPLPSVASEWQLSAGEMVWVTAGPRVQGTEPIAGGSLPSGTEIKLIWRSPSSDEIFVIATYST
jgi:hypothetical protein